MEKYGDSIFILLILFIHWIADFVFQTHKEAVGKSENLEDLLSHTITYSLTWFLPMCIIFLINDIHLSLMDFTIKSFYFTGFTFICHSIQDYFTSKINKSLWDKGDVHNFFVSIGFDQLMHMTQLILTFKILL